MIEPLCFVAGTPVHRVDGIKPIEDIRVGDYVRSRHDGFASDAVGRNKVTQLIRNEDRDVRAGYGQGLVNSTIIDPLNGAMIVNPYAPRGYQTQIPRMQPQNYGQSIGQTVGQVHGTVGTVVLPSGQIARAGTGARAMRFQGDFAGQISSAPLPPPTVPLINGRIPINSRYAGGTHPNTGVPYTNQGFPDFSQHSRAQVQLNGLTGQSRIDARMANRAAGFNSTPPGYTWHHVQDGTTMQLIPRQVHDNTRHAGGAAVIRNNGFD